MEALKLAEPPVSLARDIGVHVVGDLSGIDAQYLQDERLLMEVLREGLESESFNVLGEQSLKFPGEESGVTGFYILSESHAAFHSYPEYGYLAIDVFSCGDARPGKVVEHVARALRAGHCRTKTVGRGTNLRVDC